MMCAIYMVTTGKLSHTSNPIETEPKMKSIITMTIIAIMLVIGAGMACDTLDDKLNAIQTKRIAQLDCATDMECYELTGINY